MKKSTPCPGCQKPITIEPNLLQLSISKIFQVLLQ